MTVDHAKWPNYREGDFVIRNYVFCSGERLPELNLHYRTLGTPRRNASRKPSTVYCCYKAIPAPAPIGCGRASLTSCSGRASRSMRRSTS